MSAPDMQPQAGEGGARPAPDLLRMQRISKDFSGIRVLHEVTLRVRRGEVHALLGENGAGKSTLVKILSGAIADYEGSISIDGEAVAIQSPRDAERHGIAIIHQELNLVPELTVAENIFLGRKPQRLPGIVDGRRMVEAAAAILATLEFPALPTSVVSRLRVGEQQLVEIAKALSLDARILIMDEPTSALSGSETRTLFSVIRALRARGTTIIYISHRMEEIFELADSITVLRDGRHVATLPAADTSRGELIRLMVGRDIQDFFAQHRRPQERVVLSVRDLWLERPGARTGRRLAIAGVSFDVRAGEIFGIAGLLGAGRSEILQTLFGAADGRRGGAIFLDGRPLDIDSPVDAKRAGLSLVTEDRKFDGLVLGAGIDLNLALPSYERLSHTGVVSVAAELELVLAAMKRLGVRARDHRQVAGTLSGGNQQKVVMGKWLATEPRVLLLDEPTRGIDVGAKAEIYELLAQLAQRGLAIVIVSSEMPELLSLSDRILVMREGRPTALLERAEFSPERVMEYASPGGAVQEEFAEAAA
jgi:ribose transport system ATP-binding protein